MDDAGVNLTVIPFYMALQRLMEGSLTPPEYMVLNEYMQATWHAARYEFVNTPGGSSEALDNRNIAEACAVALQGLVDRFGPRGNRFVCTGAELRAIRACCVAWDHYVRRLPGGAIVRVLVQAAEAIEAPQQKVRK